MTPSKINGWISPMATVLGIAIIIGMYLSDFKRHEAEMLNMRENYIELALTQAALVEKSTAFTTTLEDIKGELIRIRKVLEK